MTIYFTAGGLPQLGLGQRRAARGEAGRRLRDRPAARARGRRAAGRAIAATPAAVPRLLELLVAGRRRASSTWRCSARRSSSRRGCCRRSTARATSAPCGWASARQRARCSWLFAFVPVAARHRGPLAAPGPRQPRSGAADDADAGPAAAHRHPRPGGRLLRRGQHRRRRSCSCSRPRSRRTSTSASSTGRPATGRCSAWRARRRSSAGWPG